MTTCRDGWNDYWRNVMLLMFLAGFILMLPGCGRKPAPAVIPVAPAAPVVAKVIVPVPCEVAKVAVPDYPARVARKTDDVFTLSKIALADRRVRMGETIELRAANNNPCPTPETSK